jgi:hypothetical protein
MKYTNPHKFTPKHIKYSKASSVKAVKVSVNVLSVKSKNWSLPTSARKILKNQGYIRTSNNVKNVKNVKDEDNKAEHTRQKNLSATNAKDMKANLTILDKNLTYVQHMLPKKNSKQEYLKLGPVYNRQEVINSKPKSMIENKCNS